MNVNNQYMGCSYYYGNSTQPAAQIIHPGIIQINPYYEPAIIPPTPLSVLEYHHQHLLPFRIPHWSHYNTTHDSKRYSPVQMEPNARQQYSSDEDESVQIGSNGQSPDVIAFQNRPRHGHQQQQQQQQLKEARRRKNFSNSSWQHYATLKGQHANQVVTIAVDSRHQQPLVSEDRFEVDDMEDEVNEDERGYEEEEEDEAEVEEEYDDVDTNSCAQVMRELQYHHKNGPTSVVSVSVTSSSKSAANDRGGNGKVSMINNGNGKKPTVNGHQQHLPKQHHHSLESSKPIKTRIFVNKNSQAQHQQQQQRPVNSAAGFNGGNLTPRKNQRKQSNDKLKVSYNNMVVVQQQKVPKKTNKGGRNYGNHKKHGKINAESQSSESPVTTSSEENDRLPAYDKRFFQMPVWCKKAQPKNQHYSADDLAQRKKLKPDRRTNTIIKSTLHQFNKLNLSESDLLRYLSHYLLNVESMRLMGYPLECDWNNSQAIIYKAVPTDYYSPRPKNHFDVNAQEFKPNAKKEEQEVKEDNVDDGVVLDDQSDSKEDLPSTKLLSSSPVTSSSGNSSGSEATSRTSSPRNSVLELDAYTEVDINTSDEKKCSRCGNGFFVTMEGEYLTKEHCIYHWGKLQRVLNEERPYHKEYTCCNQGPDSKGCSAHKLHVWSGLTDGYNGPFDGFVCTNSTESYQFDMDEEENEKENRINEPYKIFALDCEMCFTGRGLELGKLTVVASNGHLIYETFVKPDAEVVDYNTRFSGITESNFQRNNNRCTVKNLRQVQSDLLKFIDADTILVGHGLENDLRALKIVHKKIVDTSMVFPHFSGFPFRRSLKTLTKSILKRDIQTCGAAGHDSYEDSIACMELMLWKVRKDFCTPQITEKE